MDYFKFKMQKWVFHEGFKVKTSGSADRKAFSRRTRRVIKQIDRRFFHREEIDK